MDNNNTGHATLEELKRDALKHYDEISNKAYHWNSLVPKAIEAYNPDAQTKFLEWIDKEIEWCDRLLLGKEEPNGVTSRDINHVKDTLKLVREKFLTLTPPPTTLS